MSICSESLSNCELKKKIITGSGPEVLLKDVDLTSVKVYLDLRMPRFSKNGKSKFKIYKKYKNLCGLHQVSKFWISVFGTLLKLTVTLDISFFGMAAGKRTPKKFGCSSQWNGLSKLYRIMAIKPLHLL